MSILINYRTLVKLVELYVDGRMMQGDATALGKGGWSFRIEKEDSIRAIASAIVAEEKAADEPALVMKTEGGSYCLQERRSHSLTPQALYAHMLRDEAVFNVADPADLMEQPFYPKAEQSDPRSAPIVLQKTDDGANSLTYAQRNKLKNKQVEQTSPNLRSETLDPAFAEEMRGNGEALVDEKRKAESDKAWMRKLSAGDYDGPPLDRSRYLLMRNEPVRGNPRQTEEYRKACREAVGVGEKPDTERYPHLKEPDVDVIRWVVSRGSGCMWLPDTPRTTVKGFHHRLITRGPPIRTRLFRLNRADTEWIEKAVAEDVKRGQLEKGNSDWGFPAFPTKEKPFLQGHSSRTENGSELPRT